MKDNFYIIAMGRSGTTLLQNILDSHPNVVVPPESFFVLHLYPKYGEVKEWTETIINNFIDDLYTDRPFRIFWRVEKEDLKAAFKLQGGITSFYDACNAVRISYGKGFKKDGVTLIGDKNPIYAMFTDRVMKVNKKAKIIHLTRDPRGNARGQIKTFGKKDALFVGALWSHYNKEILKMQKKFPDQYFRLKYEDLIMDPKSAMKEVCGFLEIEFSDAMFTYRNKLESRFENYSDKLIGKHENLLKPIDISLVEKWKKDLSPKQIKRIEVASFKTARKLGYDFKRPKKDIGIIIWWPMAKFKVFFRYAVLKTYFNLPFGIRKMILSVRSKNSDHKYWNEAEKQ